MSPYTRGEFPEPLLFRSAGASRREKPSSWLPDYIIDTSAFFVRVPMLLILEELTTTLYLPFTCETPEGMCPPDTRGDQ